MASIAVKYATTLTNEMMDSFKELILRIDVIHSWMIEREERGDLNVQDPLYKRAQLIILATGKFLERINIFDVRELGDPPEQVVQFAQYMHDVLSSFFGNFFDAIAIDDYNRRFLRAHPETQDQFDAAYIAFQEDLSSKEAEIHLTTGIYRIESPYLRIGSDATLRQTFSLDYEEGEKPNTPDSSE